MKVREAVVQGTKERFRPILLTSLTTFLGVYPLIMETSLQAQFLIPLAVSIGYGVLFGTVIIVLTVPAVFMAQFYISTGLVTVIAAFADHPAPPKQPDRPVDTATVSKLNAAE
jgi:predicted RND superfamily exporter protein